MHYIIDFVLFDSKLQAINWTRNNTFMSFFPSTAVLVYCIVKCINQTWPLHAEMVNLESYDSEGPHTSETDDSAEVSVLV